MFVRRRPHGRPIMFMLLVAMMLTGAFAAVASAAPTKPQLAMGDTYSMLIKPDGSLWAWGNNQYGQLGLGVYVSARPARVGSATDWESVATGSVHTLAVKTDGTIWAWGRNNYGQLGLGDLDDRTAPTQVGTDSDWAAVAAGLRFSFALKDDGTLWAWGLNDFGQLGVGDTDSRLVPTQVGLDTDWAMVDGGGQFAAAVKTDGTMWAWGRNHLYQLGQGDTTDRPVPTQVGDDTHWVWVGASDNDCRALTDTDGLWSWGYNNYGQLGLADLVTRQVPTQVDGSWDLMTVGDDSTLATLPDGSLWAWGDNTYGQLGQGDTDHRDAPTAVGSDKDWVVVGSGHDHVGAIKNDGGLWMWGKNNSLQLGLGDATHRLLPELAFYVDDYTAPTIDSLQSPTHPDASTLYANAFPSFEWQASADQSGVVMYSKNFDQWPGTVPKPVADATSSTWTAGETADGTWYFHVRAGDAAGNWGPEVHRRVMIDATAPVTSDDAPTGWSKSDVTVHLTATDNGGSGVAGTEYKLDAGGWTSGAEVAVSGEGVHTLLYRSTDALGTVEDDKSATVRIDATAPVTTDDAPTGWSKSAVTVHLTATDDGGSGLAGTAYKLDGGGWTSGTEVKVSSQGVHTLAYRSTDGAGGVEADKSCTLRIDTKAPTTWAPRSASVRRGRYVSLYYKVKDARPGSPRATVKIKIKYRGKTVKQVTLRNRSVNKTLRYRFRCKFAKHTYRFYVYATDTAGNKQSKVRSNLLRVR